MSDTLAVLLFLCIVAACLMWPPLIVMIGMFVWLAGRK